MIRLGIRAHRETWLQMKQKELFNYSNIISKMEDEIRATFRESLSAVFRIVKIKTVPNVDEPLNTTWEVYLVSREYEDLKLRCVLPLEELADGGLISKKISNVLVKLAERKRR